jgi:hypothetical protein
MCAASGRVAFIASIAARRASVLMWPSRCTIRTVVDADQPMMGDHRQGLAALHQEDQPDRETNVALCFEIRINDGPPTITGQVGINVLSATLTFVAARKELEFRAGGLISTGPHDNEHLGWLERDLAVGDQISIRIVESDSPSAPISRERMDPTFSEREERAYYNQLKKKYDSSASSS